MRKFLRIFLWSVGIIIIIAWVFFKFFMTSMFDMSMDQKEMATFFAKAPYQPVSQTYKAMGHTLRYIDIGPDSLPVLIFIHGSPGTWEAYSSYMVDSALLRQFRMISVDRIGFGKSDHQPESSLYLQAAYLKPILDQIPNGVPVILVGHSYGGPVAVRMAMEYPEEIDGLLVLAGLADPAFDKRLWIQGPLRSPWLRWLMPHDLDMSNREICPIDDELEGMMPMWSQIEAHSVVIQGGKDMLVSKEHADFSARMLAHINPTIIRLPEENHFFIWTKPQLVKDAIIQLYKSL